MKAKYSIDFLIEQRKFKWKKYKSQTKDREFIEATAEYVFENELISEFVEKPEKLIELFFYIVDKDKNLTPFFLNDVQKDFLNTLNKAKQDFKEYKIPSIKMLVLKGRQQGELLL